MNGLCKLCKKDYKDQNGIYSNFLKHLKRAHSPEYDQIFNHENECSTEEQNIISDDRVDVDSGFNHPRGFADHAAQTR